MALVMGSAAIAGEERNGTMNVLLANPRSRTHVLLSKALALVLITALAVAAIWASVHPMAALLGVEIGGLHVEALAIHLYVNAVFYGMLALAIGAVTGNRDTATGAASGILVLSFFAVGLLPLVEGLESLRKAFPWYYFDGSEPVYNGIAWGHLVVLTAGSVALLVVAVVGFQPPRPEKPVRRRLAAGQGQGQPAPQQADRPAGRFSPESRRYGSRPSRTTRPCSSSRRQRCSWSWASCWGRCMRRCRRRRGQRSTTSPRSCSRSLEAENWVRRRVGTRWKRLA